MLERAGPQIALEVACDVKNVPAKEGSAANFRRWNNPAVNTTAEAEGVTPNARALTSTDYSATLSRYSEVFDVSRYDYDLSPYDAVVGSKDVLADLIPRTREAIRYAAAKAGSNVLYNSSAISTRVTVNGPLTLGRVQKAVAALLSAKAMVFTQMQASSTGEGSVAVEPAFFAFCHTDLQPDIRNMPGFVPAAQMSKIPAEARNPYLFGCVQNVLFFTTAELTAFADAGASVTGTGMKSTSGTSIDVYPVIICGQHALGSLRLRGSGVNGRGAMQINVLDEPTKDDPTNTRIRVAAAWYDAAVVLAQEWLYRIEVGATANPA